MSYSRIIAKLALGTGFGIGVAAGYKFRDYEIKTDRDAKTQRLDITVHCDNSKQQDDHFESYSRISEKREDDNNRMKLR